MPGVFHSRVSKYLSMQSVSQDTDDGSSQRSDSAHKGADLTLTRGLSHPLKDFSKPIYLFFVAQLIFRKPI